MRKKVTAAPLKQVDAGTTIQTLSLLLDGVEKNILNQQPWQAYPYVPAVEFAIANTADTIFLKFYVTEKSIRATNHIANSSVWEDSCVEFFIAFDNEPQYYNFEFNCIGTACVGYGHSKQGRHLLPETLIRQIKYQVVIDNQPGSEFHWELTVAIPKKVFSFNTITSLEGKQCRVNFYKCGDQLPTPHFITWSGIQSEEPDFHLPEFFGALHFV